MTPRSRDDSSKIVRECILDLFELFLEAAFRS